MMDPISRVSTVCQARSIFLLQPFKVVFCFSFFFGGGPHLRHMEVPRLGVELELYLLAYATATAM